MAASTNHNLDPTGTNGGWIAVDLDGTLAHYDGRHGTAVIGKPIIPTLNRIREWLDAGIEPRIFTARAADPTLLPPIQHWLAEQQLPPLAITHRRDTHLMQLWDDRVVQVERNSGLVLTPKQYIAVTIPGWIGVELDGTLAHYDPQQDSQHIGAPVEKMYARVQEWLKFDIDVRLFTGRAAATNNLPLISAWLHEYGLEKMKITCEKDFMMSQFWDDCGIHVVHNTGEVATTPHIVKAERKYCK